MSNRFRLGGDSFLLPDSSIARHPLFQHELRQVNGLATRAQWQRYTRRVFALVLGGGVTLWLLLVLGYSNPFVTDPFQTATGNLLLWLFIISLVTIPVIDVGCILITVNAFQRERQAGRWELLLLTGIDPRQIVTAKYYAVLASAWHFVSIIVALRIVTMFVATVAIMMWQSTGQLITGSNVISNEGMALLLLPVLILIASVYVLEAVWHMRLIIAIGLRAAKLDSMMLVIVLRAIALWGVTFVLIGLLITLRFYIVASIGGFGWGLILLAATQLLKPIEEEFILSIGLVIALVALVWFFGWCIGRTYSIFISDFGDDLVRWIKRNAI